MSKFDAYQAFVAIVDHASLSAAAKALHITPSAISKKLGLLEADLGVRLIERSTRSLSVTELGQAFYRECQSILAAVSQAEQRLLDARLGPSGKIRVSCPRVLLQPFFFRTIERFRQAYPHIRLDLSVSDSIENLIEGNLDFAFRIGTLKDSRLKSYPLMQSRPLFCAAPDYLKRCGVPLELRELEQHNVIIPTYLNVSERLKSLFSRGVSLDLTLFDSSDDVYALHQMVRQGCGIGMLLDLMVEADVRSGELIQLFPQMSFPSQSVALMWHHQPAPLQKSVVFKAFFIEHLKTDQ